MTVAALVAALMVVSLGPGQPFAFSATVSWSSLREPGDHPNRLTVRACDGCATGRSHFVSIAVSFVRAIVHGLHAALRCHDE